MAGNEIKISAEARTEFGKGAARRIRRADKVPAVIYGHGTDPVHITLPGHETLLALRTANALLSIEVDGGAAQLALPKQVQRDPIKGFVEHVDLVTVRRGEKVTVEVPIVVVGEEVPDQITNVDAQVIALEVEATDIPQHIEVDITGLEIGDQILAQDLKLPEGASLGVESEQLILSITQAREEEPEPEEGEDAEGEGAEEGAEDAEDDSDEEK
ncbi:50S ribosomal protein L25/general stress protein Ctc [Nigerium sp.]|uniref:50S ribosomal protein L25/general stress protein Ctc n=1 Tax=Nigerium sp. TaxID=2042655 RepID=UPI003221A77B